MRVSAAANPAPLLAEEEMKPRNISKDSLLAALRQIIAHVDADDSFEGSIQYAATAERDQFEVMAYYRVGNSEGQGGGVAIGERDEPRNEPADDTAWEPK